MPSNLTVEFAGVSVRLGVGETSAQDEGLSDTAHTWPKHLGRGRTRLGELLARGNVSDTVVGKRHDRDGVEGRKEVRHEVRIRKVRLDGLNAELRARGVVAVLGVRKRSEDDARDGGGGELHSFKAW